MRPSTCATDARGGLLTSSPVVSGKSGGSLEAPLSQSVSKLHSSAPRPLSLSWHEVSKSNSDGRPAYPRTGFPRRGSMVIRALPNEQRQDSVCDTKSPACTTNECIPGTTRTCAFSSTSASCLPPTFLLRYYCRRGNSLHCIE